MKNLRTPAEKLPLTTRKNLRDTWEQKKPGYEATIHDILGEIWTIDLNPNLIYQYADESYRSRLGEVIGWYIDAFIDNLKNFAKSFGVDGIHELNTVCTKHQLTLAPQEKTEFSYGGLVIDDGVLRLVFAENNLGSNVSDISNAFSEALKNAPTNPGGNTPFNLVARKSVREDYDPKIEKIRLAIASLVNMPSLILNPNFEANATELAKSVVQTQQGWDKRIGSFTLAYFESLKSILEREDFKDDDLQQEAFQGGIEKGEVRFRVLPKWDDGKSRYNEVKVDGGILYIQTTTENWGVNVHDAAHGLLDVL